jgi:pyruvate dehydrogenase E2 component (dihydrolipoamide acetyltransferase)
MPAVIRMPELLAGAAEAVLLSWYVSPGEEVSPGQVVAEIETDKATVELAADHGGVAAGLLVEGGASVAVGTPILVLAGSGESADEAMAGFAAPATPSVASDNGSAGDPAERAAAQPAAAVALSALSERRFATPLVRKLARERGIDLAVVTGTGPAGRVVRRDLEHHRPEENETVATAARPASPSSGATEPGEQGYVEIPHTAMRRAIARRLTESKSTVPHFYLEADCCVDALLELRRAIKADESIPVTPSLNDFVLKAVAAAFTEVPDANVVWTADAVRRYDSVSIAVAVAVDNGLVTPVVRNVDRRSLGDISRTTASLAVRAREGKLKQADLEGGSFAVSNLGMYGIERFAAIISPPHSGILAVGAATRRPVVDEHGALGVATMMTVTLSGDHRALDGVLGAQWLTAFRKTLENPMKILV